MNLLNPTNSGGAKLQIISKLQIIFGRLEPEDFRFLFYRSLTPAKQGFVVRRAKKSGFVTKPRERFKQNRSRARARLPFY
jgi:hypothetical protein